MKKYLLFALVVGLAACNPFQPDPPPQNINIQNTNTNTITIGTPLPNGTASPAPGTGDNVITELKCTESGGDGERTFSVGEKLTLTCTPFNAAHKDPCAGASDLSTCGAYTAKDIAWEGLDGVSQDASGVVQALGSWSNNYNYDFKALKAGTFTVRGKFKGGKAAGGLESDFVGTVK